MATASLVVKISADINDFSRKLNGMTKQVTKAADSLTDVGMSLTAGITLPAIAATVALAKFGMENEEIASRMRRQFGPAVDEVDAKLRKLMKVIPLTHSEMSEMAAGIKVMMDGMGMAADKSTKMSTALIGMAGDLAAVTGTDVPEALQALEQALQGRTRGLKQFGVTIDEAMVKQEAYRLGLLGINRDLTPLGKSLATYSLLVKQAGNFQGAAAERTKNSITQWRLLKVDLQELAETIGNTLVPAFTKMIRFARTFVEVISETPPWIVKTVATLVALAAVAGPTIIIVAKLVQAFVILRTAITLLMSKAAMGGLAALLANPVVVGAILAIAAALGTLTYVWMRYKKSVEEAAAPELPELPDVKDLLGGQTDIMSGDPLQQWLRGVNDVRTAFERAVNSGDRWIDLYGELDRLQKEALDGMMKNVGKTDEWSNSYAKVYDELTGILHVMQLMEVMQMTGKDLQKGISRASRVAVSDVGLNVQVSQSAIQAETQLRLRERTLALANTFNATRVATLELGESQREVANQMALAAAKFKQSWGNLGGSMKEAGGVMMAQLLTMFGPVALLMKAFGAVLDGLMPFIDALFTPFAELGRVIGIMLVPIFKLMFPILKYATLAIAFLGEIIARISAGIATVVGHLVRAVGKAIDALPFVSAKGIIKAGDAILDFAASQYEAADQLNKAQKEIQKMQYGAEDSLDELADAAHETAEALLNIPTGFRIALARFNATQPEQLATAGLNMAGMMRDASLVVPVMVDGKVIAKATVASLQREAQAQLGSSSRWSEVTF